MRSVSLDFFRGFTVVLMIVVNNPGSWDYIYSPLDHSIWNGCTPTDLVFPFFLFATGNSLSFVMNKYDINKSLINKIVKRFVLIFLIGLFLNWCPFFMYKGTEIVPKPWHWFNKNGVEYGIRVLGVLQRIAICYLLASIIIILFRKKNLWLISFMILGGYWLISILFGSHNDPFSLQGYFGNAVDKTIIGSVHLYKGEGIPFDPEGIMSNMSALVEVLFGYLIGNMLIKKEKNFELLSNLLLIGVAFLLLGYFLDYFVPINKKIWSSSFTIYTSGLAILLLSFLTYLIDLKKKNLWFTSFFLSFGKNPLFIFVLSGLIPRLMNLIHIKSDDDFVNPLEWFYEHFLQNIYKDARLGSFIFSLIMVLFYWLIAYVLDKKKIYIKV